jgi:hypothetical protein
MSFSISFINSPKHLLENKIHRGKIMIDDFEEVFEASLSFWTPEDYERHWKAALKILLEGTDKSCLITSMYDPKTANFLFWWPLYRNDQIVYIRNQILFFDKIAVDFDTTRPYQFVPDRRPNKQVSEWNIGVEQIRAFYLAIH